MQMHALSKNNGQPIEMEIKRTQLLPTVWIKPDWSN